MNADPQSLPNRTRPAHLPLVESGNRSVIVYLTVCTRDRKQVLARDDAHLCLRAAWKQAANWSVGRYVLMPDHLHLFCAPATLPYSSLTGWIRYWKSTASRTWPRPKERPIWQTDAWDRQLRHGDSYHEKWEYVRNNPVRERLVASPDDWPYQGEINVLFWHGE
jgi:putative transposase